MSRRIDQALSGDFSSNTIYRNLAPAHLVEHGVLYDNCRLAANGALAACSGERTGRSPTDKRVVREPGSEDVIWWGDVNVPMSTESHAQSRERAMEYLNHCERIYVVDGYAGWDEKYRIKIRVICSRPYHALFMHNMLIRPTEDELESYGEPDYVILNAGQHTADPSQEDVETETSVSIDLQNRDMVILGTEYAGEMKKGVFTIMNYLMPVQGVLSMHCSANESSDGDLSLFFGLSGTGKTTLSADPERQLIGDDEHVWTDHGVFNIEGGCYAKCIGLTSEKEPQIFSAIRFGSVLENTILHPSSCEVDYADSSLTQNTRASYPIEYIPNAKIPCVGNHPSNIIFLTCDAFGVLPPVSRLTAEQAMYHFVSGYTAKIAGTEQGVNEPQATFSACFGAAFLALSPNRYAHLLSVCMRNHAANAWLVNTGWTGGSYGEGRRIDLNSTRAIIDAIHSGELQDVETTTDPVFQFEIPVECAGCPTEILNPKRVWSDPAKYDKAAQELATLFQENFAKFSDDANEATRNAGPRVKPTESALKSSASTS